MSIFCYCLYFVTEPFSSSINQGHSRPGEPPGLACHQLAPLGPEFPKARRGRPEAPTLQSVRNVGLSRAADLASYKIPSDSRAKPHVSLGLCKAFTARFTDPPLLDQSMADISRRRNSQKAKRQERDWQLSVGRQPAKLLFQPLLLTTI